MIPRARHNARGAVGLQGGVMPLRSSTWLKGLAYAGLGVAACVLSLLGRARAADEIQVYDAAIADQGQWTLVNHANYTFNSRRGPDFPGGLDPNHAFNSTPEFAYGVAPWFEFGFYIPWAIGSVGQPAERGYCLHQRI